MQERRRVPRTRVFMAAKAVTGSRGYACLVRDISTLGGRIEFEATASIPDMFELIFDGARTIRTCRVAWRSDIQVGVEFQGLPIGRAA